MSKAGRHVEKAGKSPIWRGKPVPYGPKASKSSERGYVQNARNK